MKLFISYSRDDAQWVNDLQRALDEDGHSAWIDRRNIPSTVDWWHAICKGIADAECFLYVMTEKSVDSIYCRGELDYALSRQMPILPLMLKKCDLPPILRNKRVQYQQLSPDMNMDVVINEIEKGLEAARVGIQNGKYALLNIIPYPEVPSPELERARNFKGTRNTDWTPFITTFPKLAIPDLEWCLVPCGSFMMGNDKYYDDEKPAHLQTITAPYWIAKYPVTNAQWAQAVKAGAVPEPRGDESLAWYKDMAMADAPVTGVDWFGATQFAAWLNLNGAGVGATHGSPLQVKLPTEREWEYAARGVSNLEYPWGNDWEGGKRAVWSENSGGKPNPVTSKPEGASWVGALHQSGNVWEWCSSLQQAYPYHSHDGREDNDNRIDERLLRGGSSGNGDSTLLRVAFRSWSSPDLINYNVGFRPARS